MKKSMIALAAMAATGVSGAALAGPSWTYLDAGYTQGSSFDDEDTDGFAIRGSFGYDMWHARLEYIDGEIEGGKNSSFGADYDGYKIFVGAHPAITDNTDLVLEIGYFDVDYDEGFGDANADGFSLGAGVRSMITSNFELSGGFRAINGDIESDDFKQILVYAGGQYLFTDNIGVGVDLEIGENSNSFFGNSANLYVRWSF